MVADTEKTGGAPEKMRKEEIIQWWKKTAQAVGSEIDDLRMSKVSTITMFWLFILLRSFPDHRPSHGGYAPRGLGNDPLRYPLRRGSHLGLLGLEEGKGQIG